MNHRENPSFLAVNRGVLVQNMITPVAFIRLAPLTGKEKGRGTIAYSMEKWEVKNSRSRGSVAGV